ncbi:MAG: 3-deoxy-manno-octulosonate cytidylyltransferase [Puniceicoccales bacterium]|jgi:3-deoxy-manno-octulosonate cytidylyltransferase (CMP-KDO synthetase)|nr:3-deoxy-manno-octulosonate cytidylyltransferase [Puniceicoccales bacterium]
MGVSIAVPARFASQRFPGKILKPLGGMPLLRRVLERIKTVQGIEEIVALVDETEVAALVNSWGFRAILTSQDCISGTERIASVARELKGNFIVNVQGDEPFIALQLLEKMICRASSFEASLWTAIYPITSAAMLFDPNRVKVVIDKDDRAIYFSRSPIPYLRDKEERTTWPEGHQFWGHIGIYGYPKAVLTYYWTWTEGILEKAERLEQLRFIENGIPIRVIKDTMPGISVDTVDDLARAEAFLKLH